MNRPHERRRLRKWLQYADTIIGMNLQFDIQYLRLFDQQFRFALDGSHTLIDLAVVNFLHDETRPEKSLKSLGPVLRTHSYDLEDRLGKKRYLSPHSPAFQKYNCQDTHNTMLAVAELSRRIIRDY